MRAASLVHSLYAVCEIEQSYFIVYSYDFLPLCVSSSHLFPLASCPYALLRSQDVTKQVLAGGKGAESDGEPCDANGRHQEGSSVCRETSCSRAHSRAEGWASWSSTRARNWQAGYLHNIFPLDLPSPSPSQCSLH